MKVLAIAAVIASLVLTGQDPAQPQRPVFKSAVDVVPVDVSVVDRTGRPVSDLTAADFELTVDGKPRRIASAQFISLARLGEEAAPPEVFHSSNAGSVGGRLIALVIDQGNIGAGTGKLAVDAARRFVAGLNRADRVALYTLPGAGPRIDFTSNHALVSGLLESVVGGAGTNVGPRSIGISEAIGLERNDHRTITTLLDRECPGFRTPEQVAECQRQLTGEARALSAEMRARTLDSLLGLREVMGRLAVIPSPKTLVMLSEGLIVDRELSDLSWVAELAARAQMSLYVLQLEPPMFDASNPRLSATRMADIDLGQQGLSHLTGLARGDVFRVTAGADFAFSRISRELSGHYLLSFQPEARDRDGRPHKIRIRVPGRRDLTVRARPEFAVDAASRKTSEQVLADTLRSPLLSTDIGLKVTTYSFWDVETKKMRVVIAAAIDRSASRAGTVSFAYALLDQKGALAGSHFEPALDTPISGTGEQAHVVAALVPPGIYTLKLAVLDGEGKRGSVEYAFRSQLAPAGQVRIGGLLLATRDANTGPLRTVVSGEVSADVLHAYLELYSDAPEQLQHASVVVEVAQSEEGRALDSAIVRFQQNREAGVRVGEAAVPIALLPPGDYIVRAVASVSGRKAGQMVRPFRIVASR